MNTSETMNQFKEDQYAMVLFSGFVLEFMKDLSSYIKAIEHHPSAKEEVGDFMEELPAPGMYFLNLIISETTSKLLLNIPVAFNHLQMDEILERAAHSIDQEDFQKWWAKRIEGQQALN